MSISISTSLPAAPAAANSSADAAASQKNQPATQGPSDVVNVSANQQVHQLHNQGQRVAQIAFSLNLSVETVNSYLGITNTTT